MGRIGDLVLLGLLEWVFFLPIITAGASFTAAYDVCMKMHRNEEGPVVSGFLRSFRKNFKESTPGWLVILFVSALTLVDLKILRTGGSSISRLGYGCVLAMLAMVITFVSWYFSYRARFSDTFRGAFRCSLMFMLSYLPVSLGILGLEMIVLIFLDLSFPLVFAVFFFGMGLMTYPKAAFFDGCYAKYIKEHQTELKFESEEIREKYNTERESCDIASIADPMEKKLKGMKLLKYRLSKMNGRQKASYLTSYYGKGAAAAVAILAFVILTVHSAVVNRQKKEPHVIAVNALQSEESGDDMIEICRVPYDKHTGNAFDYSDYEKFFIKISLGQVDCAIIPESFAVYCNNVDAIFRNVGDVLGEEEMRKNSDRLFVGENSDGVTLACGIRVTDLPYTKMTELQFTGDNAGEEMILVFPINAANSDFCREYTQKVLG